MLLHHIAPPLFFQLSFPPRKCHKCFSRQEFQQKLQRHVFLFVGSAHFYKTERHDSGHTRALIPKNGWDHQATIRREQAPRPHRRRLKNVMLVQPWRCWRNWITLVDEELLQTVPHFTEQNDEPCIHWRRAATTSMYFQQKIERESTWRNVLHGMYPTAQGHAWYGLYWRFTPTHMWPDSWRVPHVLRPCPLGIPIVSHNDNTSNPAGMEQLGVCTGDFTTLQAIDRLLSEEPLTAPSISATSHEISSCQPIIILTQLWPIDVRPSWSFA